MKNIKNRGFTLAETMVVLVIFGIVSAIIIPSIYQNYQKQNTIIKLKKAYSVLNTVTTNFMSNTGCINMDVSCSKIFDIYNSASGNANNKEDAINQFFIEKSGLKIVKTYNNSSIAPKRLSSDVYDNVFAVRVVSFTADGIGYSFNKITHSTKDGQYKDAIGVAVFTEPKKIYSGSKELVNGRNIFKFMIYDNFQVQPLVNGWYNRPLSQYLASGKTSDIYKYCNPEEPDGIIYSGDNCAARIVYEGWKINY